MRRWLPVHVMSIVIIALLLVSIQWVFAQSASPTATKQPPTPTPESVESLATATFTPLPTTARASATPTGTRAATATPTPTIAATPILTEQTYTVVSGDRLVNIAQDFGLTVACIAAANNIANPDLIYVGQELLITPNCTSGSGGGVVTSPLSNSSDTQFCRFDRNAGRVATSDSYVVQAGDSLDFIACDFGVELQCLKDSNPQLEGLSFIMPGQVLTINFSCPIWRDSSLPQPTATAAG